MPVICEFVFRFLAIHPFQDGNGRLGRGLFLLGMLQSSDCVISSIAPLIALDRQIEKHRDEYYFILNSCSSGKYSEDPTDYKIEFFVKFMVKMLSLSIADVEIYRTKDQAVNALSENASKILGIFKESPELKLTNKYIVEQTALPRRTVTHILGQLVDKQLVQKYGQGAGVHYQLTF